MRAMVLEKPRTPLVMCERPTPTPAAGEILVEVAACGVCRTDLHVVDGELPDPKLPIVQQETFGPVLTLQVFDNEREAVTLANDSEFGLSASVWTRDVDRSLRIAQALEVGSVWINDWAKVYDSTEEGGFKQSGLGRLNGLAALDDFIEYKHIALRPGLMT